MKHSILEKINQTSLRQDGAPLFAVGDTVKVSVKIKEGEKERVQSFSGTVIARKGSGATETFIVRRVSHGEGVEQVFPVHSPNIVKVEVVNSFEVRRAKLYYLRDRIGKAARLKSKKRKIRKQ